MVEYESFLRSPVRGGDSEQAYGDPMTHDGSPAKPVYWPWFIGGLLGPIIADLLTKWITRPLAAGMAFLVLFAVASSIVARRSDPRGVRIGRIVLASGVGALIVGGFTYLSR